MSAFATVRSDLELYFQAHEAAIGRATSRVSAPLAHSLVLTRQLITAFDSADITSALHITFCQTVNLLSLSVASAPGKTRHAPKRKSEPADDEDLPGFAGFIGDRMVMSEVLPWLPLTYSRYCDGLWSSSWKPMTTSNGKSPGRRVELEAVDPLMFDIVCDFAQLTETLLSLTRISRSFR